MRLFPPDGCEGKLPHFPTFSPSLARLGYFGEGEAELSGGQPAGRGESGRAGEANDLAIF